MAPSPKYSWTSVIFSDPISHLSSSFYPHYQSFESHQSITLSSWLSYIVSRPPLTVYISTQPRSHPSTTLLTSLILPLASLSLTSKTPNPESNCLWSYNQVADYGGENSHTRRLVPRKYLPPILLSPYCSLATLWVLRDDTFLYPTSYFKCSLFSSYFLQSLQTFYHITSSALSRPLFLFRERKKKNIRWKLPQILDISKNP